MPESTNTHTRAEGGECRGAKIRRQSQANLALTLDIVQHRTGQAGPAARDERLLPRLRGVRCCCFVRNGRPGRAQQPTLTLACEKTSGSPPRRSPSPCSVCLPLSWRAPIGESEFSFLSALLWPSAPSNKAQQSASVSLCLFLFW